MLLEFAGSLTPLGFCVCTRNEPLLILFDMSRQSSCRLPETRVTDIPIAFEDAIDFTDAFFAEKEKILSRCHRGRVLYEQLDIIAPLSGLRPQMARNVQRQAAMVQEGVTEGKIDRRKAIPFKWVPLWSRIWQKTVTENILISQKGLRLRQD